MPNLFEAYRFSLLRRRNPAGLEISVSGETETPGVLEFWGQVNGGSDPHSVTIQFRDVLPKDVKQPLSKKLCESRAVWHCDCTDFQHTFYPHIAANVTPIFPFPDYEVKGTGTPRMVDDFGMCKHVMAFVNHLVATKALPVFKTGA